MLSRYNMSQRARRTSHIRTSTGRGSIKKAISKWLKDTPRDVTKMYSPYECTYVVITRTFDDEIVNYGGLCSRGRYQEGRTAISRDKGCNVLANAQWNRPIRSQCQLLKSNIIASIN